jgi:hypothetical protein
MMETPQTSASSEGAPTRPTIDRKLLDLLVCPVTKGVLHYDHERQELVSHAAKVAYPIRDSIPIMLIEEARELEEAELAKLKGSTSSASGS